MTRPLPRTAGVVLQEVAHNLADVALLSAGSFADSTMEFRGQSHGDPWRMLARLCRLRAQERPTRADAPLRQVVAALGLVGHLLDIGLGEDVAALRPYRF